MYFTKLICLFKNIFAGQTKPEYQTDIAIEGESGI